MTHVRIQKTNFTAGEVSPDLLGRGDLRAYDNGASQLRNVFVNPTGGLTRRPGLRYIDGIGGKSRLIAFEFNTEQVYLLVLGHLSMAIYRDDTLITSIATPWTADHLKQINWVQSADTLLITHPDVEPRKITRTSDTDWTIGTWSYVTVNNRIQQPHFKFAPDAVTIAPGGTSGSIRLTASADIFHERHTGCRFRIVNREVEITGVSSATVATAVTKETLTGTSATEDWEEQAFSPVRGWPVSLCFHQDRLVLGGSRDAPNKLWMSKSSDLYNFDLGEGLDDESIDFAILSDQVNAIRAVFSGRHLQVFTSGAEWMVTGDPLTPVNIQLNRQTRIGSPVDHAVPPRDVDGATLFVPRSGSGLREFLFADVEQAYQSNDLAMLARHLVRTPIDQDYDNTNRLLHLVMSDGTIGTVTIFRSEKVTAWCQQITNGYFRGVAIADGSTYVLVERNNKWMLEKFDETLNSDSSLDGTSMTPKATWSGLDHMEGNLVTVLSENAVQSPKRVSGGKITLDYASTSIEVGYPYTHCIAPMPPTVQSVGGPGQGRSMRPISHTFRIQNSASLRLDTGKGFLEIPFKRLGNSILDRVPEAYTGDKTVRAFGWRRGGTAPLWRIEHDVPVPFTLLSVSSEISING